MRPSLAPRHFSLRRTGDFPKGHGSLSGRTLRLPSLQHSFLGEEIPLSEVTKVEAATEESARRMGTSIGLAGAGLLLLGPLGLLAGAFGGTKKQVTFVALFRDGRRLLATADGDTYTRLLGQAFDSGRLASGTGGRPPSGSPARPAARVTSGKHILYVCPACKTKNAQVRHCSRCGAEIVW